MHRYARIGGIALIAVLIAALPAAAEQAPIAIGPYVQNVGKDSATICWATRSWQVSYDPADLTEQTAIRSYQHHSVTLRYLKPGTTYSHDILGDGSDAGKGSFTTVPEGEQPFKFVVYGDTRSYEEIHRRIVERIIAEKPDLVFNTGDLVTNGLHMFWWESFFRATGDLMRNVPYYPVLGNHERDAQLYFDFFSLPGNERYYSFDRGAVHFVVLDSTGPSPAGVAAAAEQRCQQEHWREQMAWLADDLAAHNDAKYIFVYLHHPLYSAMAKRQALAQEVRERFGTLLEKYRVSAVFSGHDHHYHRAVAGGVQFVTAAGGGAPLYEIDSPRPETVKSAKIHHYVSVEAGPERAVARVTDIDGQMVDRFQMRPRALSGAQ